MFAIMCLLLPPLAREMEELDWYDLQRNWSNGSSWPLCWSM